MNPERERELLQIILEIRELAHLQAALAKQDAVAVVDWETLETKLSVVLDKFGVVKETDD